MSSKMMKVLESVAAGDLNAADQILGEMMMEFAQSEYQALGGIPEEPGEDELSLVSADLAAEPEVALEPAMVEPAITAPADPADFNVEPPADAVAMDAPMDMAPMADVDVAEPTEVSTDQQLADLETDIASLMRRYQDLITSLGAEGEIEPAVVDPVDAPEEVPAPALPMDGSEVEAPMAAVAAPEEEPAVPMDGAEPETMLDDIGESLNEEKVQTVGDGDSVDVNTDSPVVSHPVADRMDRAGDSHKAHPGTKGFNPETPPTVKKPSKKPPTLSPVSM